MVAHDPLSIAFEIREQLASEKRRLAFIAAIYNDPDIIIIDEITNGLDKANKKWLVSKICALRNDNKT